MKLIFFKIWFWFTVCALCTGILLPWLVSNNILPFFIIILLVTPIYVISSYAVGILIINLFKKVNKKIDDKIDIRVNNE